MRVATTAHDDVERPFSSISRPERPSVGLDALRGLSALAVLLFHIRNLTLSPYRSLPDADHTLLTQSFYLVGQFGHEAVLTFFALSGFLVFGPILTVRRPFDLRRYGLARSSRILVPLLPTCLFATGAAMWLGWQGGVHGGPSTGMGSLAAAAAGLNGVVTGQPWVDPPLWSVAYEVWFYVFGAGVGLILARTRPLLTTALMLLCALVFLQLQANLLLCWVIGGVVVFFRDRPGQYKLAVAGVFVAVAGTIIYQASLGVFGSVPISHSSVGETMVAIGVALTLPSLSNQRTSALLSWLRVPAGALSAISYSLYLTHYPTLLIMCAFHPATHGTPFEEFYRGAWLAGFCVFVAVIFWAAFEARTAMLRALVSKV